MWENFIGQSNLKKELLNLKDHPISLLLRGNSGYGKTTLARLYADSRGLYDYQLGSTIDKMSEFYYNITAVTHIVDEIHELKSPEILYPFMDSGMVFIFCTNESDNLKEPLRNRCVERFLKPYTNEELKSVIKLQNNFSDEILDILVERSRGIPRMAIQLGTLVKINCNTDNPSEVIDYLNNSVGMDGFTEAEHRYLRFIKEARKASLNVIKSNINMPENQIRYEIEPYLIRKRLVTIGSGGRIYIGE